MTEDLRKFETRQLVRELEGREDFVNCYHVDDCDCVARADALNDAETDALMAELETRGAFDDDKLDRREVEYSYEELLRGDVAKAIVHLKQALCPNGGADVIAMRVKRDQIAMPLA